MKQQLQISLDKGIAVSQQEKGSVQQESGCQGGQQSIIMRTISVNALLPHKKPHNQPKKPTITTK